MKLFYSKGACSLSTHIIINELGLKCDFEAVNLATKKTETDADFYTVNPKGAVPTLLLDDGEIITENIVIQQYLVDTYENDYLCPPVGKIARYHVLEWLSYAASDFHKAFTPFFAYKSITDQTIIDMFTNTLKAKINHLEKQLNNHTYIAGDHFTLPDAYIFVVLRWLGVAKLSLSDWPNLKKYFDLIRERPAVKKSMEEEGF